MTLRTKIAGAACAAAISASLLGGSVRADTISPATSVGLGPNSGGTLCGVSLGGGSDFNFGTAVWNAGTHNYDIPSGGVKNITINVVNTFDNELCQVTVGGTALTNGVFAIPIHDLKLEQGTGSGVTVNTVAAVPDLNVPESAALLIASAANGSSAIVKATLSNAHMATLPSGLTYSGTVTLTGSAVAP